MSLPVGVPLVTLQFGPYVSASGAAGKVAPRVRVRSRVTHLATGLVLDPASSATVTTRESDGAVLVDVPPCDAAGFVDGAGFEVSGWSYEVGGTVSYGSRSKPLPTRLLSPLASVEVVLVDTLPIPGEPGGVVRGDQVVVVQPGTDPGSGEAPPALVVNQTTPLATWTVPHPFGRRPSVAVYVAGAEVIADVDATSTTVTVTHAAPTAGQLILT